MLEKRLLHAAKNGNLKEVRNLIQKEVNINCKDIYGSSPLDEAAFFGKVEVVEFLLLKGADKNSKDVKWNTPLWDKIHNKAKRSFYFFILI